MHFMEQHKPEMFAELSDELKAKLTEKGFEDSVTVSEKKQLVSADAVALSQQLKTAGASEVRSIIKTTGSTQPTSTGTVNPNLREVIVNGSGVANYSSLKSVAFGSMNDRMNPVRLNGKAYRGKIEVFVNSRGSLTVVNVVPLEDYLLGVVPSELGLPAIEAQKAIEAGDSMLFEDYRQQYVSPAHLQVRVREAVHG